MRHKIQREILPDGVREITTDENGNVSDTFIPAEGSRVWVHDKAALLLRDALVENVAFLEGGGEDHEQLIALTRQVNALIRFHLGDFSSDRGL
jgi:hypothetical protein